MFIKKLYFIKITFSGKQQWDHLINHSYRYHALFPKYLDVFDTITNQHARRKILDWHCGDLHLFHYTCDVIYDHGTIHTHDSNNINPRKHFLNNWKYYIILIKLCKHLQIIIKFNYITQKLHKIIT